MERVGTSFRRLKLFQKRFWCATMVLILTAAWIPAVSVKKASAASYNAQNAINYAQKYAYNYNSAYPVRGSDCANFVSQCLEAGGIPRDTYWSPNCGVDPATGYNNWYTTSLKDYLINKGYTVIWNPSANQILPGNPVFYSYNSSYGKTTYNGTAHAAICVSNTTGSNPMIAAHSNNHDSFAHSSMMRSFRGCCTILLNRSTISDNTSTSTDNPGSPYPIPTTNLANGSRGDSVKWVQQGLNEVSGAGLAVDGQYGSNTINAVKTFQRNQGLTVDGIVGTNTTNRLLTLWREKKSASKDTEKPSVSNVSVSEVSLEGYRVTCNVSDNVGVTMVKFPTWTTKGGQDDLIWHVANLSGGTATLYIKTSEHKNGKGSYLTHIYAYDAAGNYVCHEVPSIDVSALGAKQDVGTGFYATIVNKETQTALQQMSDGDVRAYKETGDLDQLWYFTRQSDGVYEVTNLGGDKGLDYWGAYDDANTNISAHKENDTDAQRWKLYSAGNGAYYFQGKSCEDTLLDLDQTSAADNTNVTLQSMTKGSGQQFEIHKYYKVLFENGESVIKTQYVRAGESATAPVLVKNGYKLTWSEAYDEVNEDLTVKAVWTKLDMEVTEPSESNQDASEQEQADTQTESTDTESADKEKDITDQLPETSNASQSTEDINDPAQNTISEDGSTQDSKVASKQSDQTDDAKNDNTQSIAIQASDEEEAEEEVTVNRAKIQTARNVKGKKIRLKLKNTGEVDGYELVIGSGSARKIAKFKRALRRQEDVSIGGFETFMLIRRSNMITGLRKGTTYYIAVRAYVNTDEETIFGDYSKVKRVRVKK